MFSTYLHFRQPIRFADNPSKGLGIWVSNVDIVLTEIPGEGVVWESEGVRGLRMLVMVSRPGVLLTMSHWRADSDSRVSIRRLKNSWASCCSRVARRRFLSLCMSARAT